MAGHKGFLTPKERGELQDIMRKRKTEALKARRANALLALDEGRSVAVIAEILYLNPETIRTWLRDFLKRRLASMDLATYPGQERRLDRKQEKGLQEQFQKHPPRNTSEIRDTILRLYGVEYSLAGVARLMHRLGFKYVRPKSLPLYFDKNAQEIFAATAAPTQNTDPKTILYADKNAKEVFAKHYQGSDETHPEHQYRPTRGWIIRSKKLAPDPQRIAGT